jgi:hypothetical protein
MKPYALIIYCLVLSLASNSFAADLKPKEKDKTAQKVYGDVVVSEDIKKLLVVPGVQKVFDECKTKDLANISECMWEKDKLNAQQKKQIQAIYASEIENKTVDEKGRSIASTDKSNLTARVKNVGIDYASDPAVAALSKYYGDKLDEILTPTKADYAAKKIVTVDHTKFIELYKSELGKTIISAFTSYCLETDPDTCCTDANKSKCKLSCKIVKDEKERSKHKEDNLKSLSKASMDMKGNDATKWNKCIADVSDVCFEGAVTTNTDASYSAQRACVIVDYVKAARKNILIVDDQLKFYDGFQNNKGIYIDPKDSNMKIVDGEKISADAILEMTAKDVEDTLKDSTAAQIKEMKACVDANGMIADINACKKFLNTNKDANVAAVTEFGLRQLAQEDTLTKELNSGDDKVKAYLKEEGFEEAQITELSNKENIENTKAEIIKRYKEEKKAIIAEMASRIGGKTVSGNGKIDAASRDDKSKLEAIQSQLNSRGIDLANLVKFNNIVSSYLIIEDGEGKQTRNTASLFAESRDLHGEDAKTFQKNIENAGLKDKKNSPNLNVDTINNVFLDYDKKP